MSQSSHHTFDNNMSILNHQTLAQYAFKHLIRLICIDMNTEDDSSSVINCVIDAT